VIVDASLVIDAVSDSGPRGFAARDALGKQPAAEVLIAPGHFAFEIMSGLRAAANRPGHPFQAADLPHALRDAESYEIAIEATPWTDVHRAWELAEQSLSYADAIYVAAAERHRTALLTADGRIERSGAPMDCQIITVTATKNSTLNRPPKPLGAGKPSGRDHRS
jgi:predicted nucleic acid-binding protein